MLLLTLVRKRLAPLLGYSFITGCLCLLSSTVAAANSPHILVISVDGMHALDLALFVKTYPNSTMAGLVRSGYNYTSASTPKPSDSLPGNLALCTGGSPLSTGVFYDRSYDRSLWPPNTFSGATPRDRSFTEHCTLKTKAVVGKPLIDAYLR